MSYQQSAPLSTDQPRGEGEKGLGLMKLLTVEFIVQYFTKPFQLVIYKQSGYPHSVGLPSSRHL